MNNYVNTKTKNWIFMPSLNSRYVFSSAYRFIRLAFNNALTLAESLYIISHSYIVSKGKDAWCLMEISLIFSRSFEHDTMIINRNIISRDLKWLCNLGKIRNYLILTFVDSFIQQSIMYESPSL